MNKYEIALAALDMIDLGMTVDALRARYQADEAAGQTWEESQAKAKAAARQALDEAAKA